VLAREIRIQAVDTASTVLAELLVGSERDALQRFLTGDLGEALDRLA
jgi:hypothetical protein